jgi:hypothetical protein
VHYLNHYYRATKSQSPTPKAATRPSAAGAGQPGQK